MDGAKKGNAIGDGSPRRGWFVGRFINDDAYRQTHDVEIKWGVHKEGESNRGFRADQVARSLCVLIRGRLRFTFRKNGQTEEILLDKEGDYAVWLPGVEHTWVAEEKGETIVLTIRWPSYPIPQIENEQES